jgi:hypothetical protein
MVSREQRNKEKWFPSKKSTCAPRASDLLDLRRPSRPERMRESGSLEKKFSPRRAGSFDFLGRRSGRGGMRKSGSAENKMRRPRPG